jgi:hypothetical protein
MLGFALSYVSLDDMFKVATIVQQIMTELNGAVSEEGTIVAITKIVLNLMKRDGHWSSHRSVICMWLSKFHTFTISSQNYAGSKQKSYKIIRIQMFVRLDKAKPITETAVIA